MHHTKTFSQKTTQLIFHPNKQAASMLLLQKCSTPLGLGRTQRLQAPRSLVAVRYRENEKTETTRSWQDSPYYSGAGRVQPLLQCALYGTVPWRCIVQCMHAAVGVLAVLLHW